MIKQYKRGLVLLTVIVTLAVHAFAVAADQPSGWFLSDYAKLKPTSDDPGASWLYVAPGAIEKMADYNAIMIDQPEISIAEDSKYKGMKANDMAALADGLRAAVARELEGAYLVVDQAGPNVIYMRIAVVDLHLKKKKKNVLGYTPIGLVAGGAKSLISKDVAKKMSLQDMRVELEVQDSQTGEQLLAIIEPRSGGEADPASWEELESLMVRYGKRARCRFDNMRLPEDQRVDCIKTS